MRAESRVTPRRVSHRASTDNWPHPEKHFTWKSSTDCTDFTDL